MLILRGSWRAVVFIALALSSLEAAGILSCDKATSPPVIDIVAVNGDGATGEVGSALSPEPSVRVTTDGQPASRIAVAWSPEDGGSVAAASSVTGAAGIASVGWTLGTKPGVQHLSASLTGGQSMRITATARAGGLAAIALKPDAIVLADIGETATLVATALDRYGNELQGMTQAWRSLEPAIAVVDARGVVSGLARGSARIVASSGAAADTALVEVRRPAGSIVVAPRVAMLNALGARLAISAVVRDRRGVEMPEAAVQWSSSDTALLTVDTDGSATARGIGVAVVRASADSARDSALVSVRQVPARLRAEPATALVTAGDSLQLTAVVLDSLGAAIANAVVSWTSGDTALAMVGANGCVLALRPGMVDVAVSSGVLTAVVRVTVVAGRPAVVRVTPDSASVYVGATQAFAATVADARGNPLPASIVAWSSSDPIRAAVDAQGLVTGLAAGTVLIGARADTASAQARVTVVQPPPAAAVRITTRDVQLHFIGASTRLSATVVDARGIPVPAAMAAWRTLDPALVSISSVGQITQLGRSGSARVVASYGSLADTVIVAVRQVPRQLIFSPPMFVVGYGDSTTLSVTMVDSAAAPIPVDHYNISNIGFTGVELRAVASPDLGLHFMVRGLVPSRGIPYGFTLFTASGDSVAACYTVDVTPPKLTPNISPRSVTLNYIRDYFYFNAVLLDTLGRVVPDFPVSWRSLSPAASVTETGGVVELARSATPAQIVASYVGADTVLVYLRQIAKTIAASPGSLVLLVGDSTAVSVTAIDSGGSAIHGIEATTGAAHAAVGPPQAGDRVWVYARAAGSGPIGITLGEQQVQVAVTVTERPSGNLAPASARPPAATPAQPTGAPATPPAGAPAPP